LVTAVQLTAEFFSFPQVIKPPSGKHFHRQSERAKLLQSGSVPHGRVPGGHRDVYRVKTTTAEAADSNLPGDLQKRSVGIQHKHKRPAASAGKPSFSSADSNAVGKRQMHTLLNSDSEDEQVADKTEAEANAAAEREYAYYAGQQSGEGTGAPANDVEPAGSSDADRPDADDDDDVPLSTLTKRARHVRLIYLF
jgi:hypothetical protein